MSSIYYENWIWLHFRWKTIWVMGRAKSMYVSPCKCCSRSHQRSSPGLGLRSTALLVLMERVWWISHSIITSSALGNIWQNTFHTPVVEEGMGPRDICQAVITAIFPSGVLQQLFECLPQSLPDITVLNKRWSKASGFRKQCHEGSTTSSHVMTPLV